MTSLTRTRCAPTPLARLNLAISAAGACPATVDDFDVAMFSGRLGRFSAAAAILPASLSPAQVRAATIGRYRGT